MTNVITMIAAGSRGDVQPYVALGTGLRAAGHTVRIVTSDDFQTLVTTYGLEFVSIGIRSETAAQAEIKGLLEKGNSLQILARTGRGAKQLAQQGAVAGLAACADADLIVGGIGNAFTGLALSDKLGIPFVPAYLLPFTPTRHRPSPLLPLPKTPLTNWANRFSHRLTQQMMWQMFRAADREVRTQALNLPPAPFWGPFTRLNQQPTLYGYSADVLPPPPDWPDHVQVTGYWFLDEAPTWTPPAALTAFLTAGSPPIYVGFGSMPSSRPEETAALVLAALEQTGQRGILYSGWGGLQQHDLPKSVFMIGSTPHSWLFPRMAGIVHHGGAGTTAAGLRAGVPSIITPFFGDQPFWGRTVHGLGVGPQPIPRRQLTVDNLAAAIRQAITDTTMQQRAAVLGRRIRSEDGVAQAVAALEALL